MVLYGIFQIGDKVDQGEPILHVHHSDQREWAAVKRKLDQAIHLEATPMFTARPLVLKVIR